MSTTSKTINRLDIKIQLVKIIRTKFNFGKKNNVQHLEQNEGM